MILPLGPTDPLTHCCGCHLPKSEPSDACTIPLHPLFGLVHLSMVPTADGQFDQVSTGLQVHDICPDRLCCDVDASTLGISSEQWQPRSGDMLGIRCAGIRAAACQTGAHSVNFVCLVHDVHVLLGSLSC